MKCCISFLLLLLSQPASPHDLASRLDAPLLRLGLLPFKDQLVDRLGVDCAEDLQLIEADDLKALGIPGDVAELIVSSIASEEVKEDLSKSRRPLPTPQSAPVRPLNMGVSDPEKASAAHRILPSLLARAAVRGGPFMKPGGGDELRVLTKLKKPHLNLLRQTAARTDGRAFTTGGARSTLPLTPAMVQRVAHDLQSYGVALIDGYYGKADHARLRDEITWVHRLGKLAAWNRTVSASATPTNDRLQREGAQKNNRKKQRRRQHATFQAAAEEAAPAEFVFDYLQEEARLPPSLSHAETVRLLAADLNMTRRFSTPMLQNHRSTIDSLRSAIMAVPGVWRHQSQGVTDVMINRMDIGSRYPPHVDASIPGDNYDESTTRLRPFPPPPPWFVSCVYHVQRPGGGGDGGDDGDNRGEGGGGGGGGDLRVYVPSHGGSNAVLALDVPFMPDRLVLLMSAGVVHEVTEVRPPPTAEPSKLLVDRGVEEQEGGGEEEEQQQGESGKRVVVQAWMKDFT